jgi:hypothetical protein
MNEICERALACYIKKLENDNKMLREFANEVRGIIFDNNCDNDTFIVKDIRDIIRTNEFIFKED